MAFNCSVLLSDLDSNCAKSVSGGIKNVYLGLKENLTLTLNQTEEKVLTYAHLKDFVVFEHNPKDSTTSFSENKETQAGLPVVTTDIVVRIPAIDNRALKIEQMSYRNDIVCVLIHNNGTATISGWQRGLDINYDLSSGASITDVSNIEVTLTGQSWESSIATNDPTLIKLGSLWNNQSGTWSTTNLNWN